MKTRLKRYGHKLLELRTLIALHLLNSNATATEISKYLLLNKSDMTAVLKSLETKGAIEKKRIQENRRIKEISITMQGLETVENMLPVLHDILLETCRSSEQVIGVHLKAAQSIVGKMRRLSFLSQEIWKSI